MFGFYTSKKRKDAKALFSMACKVYDYRRDLMAERDAASMADMIEKLDELILDGKVGTQEYDSTADSLKKLMRKCGGTIYPVNTIGDYVDTIIVAGILAIGIRSFFIQPFKIPTNSMYPSFYGMTSQVYGEENPPPNALKRLTRFLTLSASNYKLESPKDCDVLIEVNTPEAANRKGGAFNFDMVNVRKYLGLWPTTERVYRFLAGDEELELAIPADFNLDSVITKAFPMEGVDPKDISAYLQAAYEKNLLERRNGKIYLNLGKYKRGQTFLDFDILGGDMLFVDRFSYNFTKPKIGDPIVFLTKYCDGMTMMNHGVPDDKYYIKRLVGAGGDTLSVKDDTLFINGKPAEGSDAFKKNANKIKDYCGYKPEGIFKDGGTAKVHPHHYFAMGDNSANSLDSRYWGQVPERAVVGKALIIFYPFSARWGPAE